MTKGNSSKALNSPILSRLGMFLNKCDPGRLRAEVDVGAFTKGEVGGRHGEEPGDEISFTCHANGTSGSVVVLAEYGHF